MSLRLARVISVTGLAMAFAGAGALPASAGMESEQISKHLCKTKGGGKFVGIPGFPGERIDRRLIPDIQWMKRNYHIFITDGFAMSGHAINGEHPIGLAADIIPRQHGGRWGLIGKLAERFEPRQNQVRMPMRWVGYDGDPGHGRGHHLHLSWAHSDNTTPGKPARVVYTRKCPKQPGGGSGGGGGGSGSGGSGGVGRKHGGLTAAERSQLAPVVPEPHERHGR